MRGDLPPTWGVRSLNPTHPGADPSPQDEHLKASPLHSLPLPSTTPEAPAGVAGFWLERALEQVPSLPGGNPNDTGEADQVWGGVSGVGVVLAALALRWTHPQVDTRWPEEGLQSPWTPAQLRLQQRSIGEGACKTACPQNVSAHTNLPRAQANWGLHFFFLVVNTL